MDAVAVNLLLGAAGVALVHTALGPDHYLPFVVLGRARAWSTRRTLLVTAVCGVGHVVSSILLGGVGLLLGAALGELEAVETHRGTAAAWALVTVGGAYALWGWRHARRMRTGLAVHAHGDVVHLHHHGDAAHRHRDPRGTDTTFWVLFVVFVLGPCEPMLPLFVLPSAEGRWELAAAAAAVFAVVTLVTMLLITGLLLRGVRAARLGGAERWSHTLAGSVIASSGAAILLLGV